MTRIAFCQATFRRDWEATKKHIETWLPFVDYVVIVVDETVSGEEIRKVEERWRTARLVIKQVEFPESLPEFRNHYVEECRRLGVDWFCVSDPDEYVCEEFRRDFRAIVDWAEEHGYNQLGLVCKEQFEVIEWLPFDKLDEAKEFPGGIRESDYYKFLVNKICCDRFRYEGVGVTKNVHETWGCPIHPRRGVYLPRKYYYVHRKSAYDVWRNAARNVFIGGGGDNVGETNEMWVELRRICGRLGIRTWREFEEYITSGKPLPPELVDWVRRALTWRATDYGIETRETAKWIIFHHRRLLEDPEIRHGVWNPPRPTEEDEVEMYVRRCYFQILGRHPDRGGLEHWKGRILRGEIRREDLPGLLRQSPEYVEKFALQVPVEVPTEVSVRLDQRTAIQLLARSPLWFSVIKPRLDVGRFVLERVPEGFLDWFYRERHRITLEDFVRKLQEYCGGDGRSA